MITSDGAKKALQKRKKLAEAACPIVLDLSFPKQNALIEDKSRYIAAQCSRRAGKTNSLAIRFLRTMEKYPKSQCIYLSLTQDSARDIMWPVLQELNDRFRLGCTFVESKLTVSHPNGAKLRLMGADLSNFIKRLKGRKYPGVAIDEAQDFGSHLQSLIDDVLTPSISDYEDGWLAITGTPGPVPQGFFFEVTQQRKYGYSLHHWTLFDNPYMPNPQAFVEDLKTRREWDDNNPTLLREWKNQWVLDVESLWIRYHEKMNDYDQLPDLPSGQKWNYILGIDIGFQDADALAVVAWSEHTPKTYLIKEIVTSKQGLTELVEQIKELRDTYDIGRMVIDEGGLGKKLAEEMRRRHHIPVEGADKSRKQETVEFFNDALRTGRFMAKKHSRFAQDTYLIQIDWDKSSPNKVVIKKKPHSDIIDAVLYAFKESPAFTFQAKELKLIPGTREWAEAQESSMFDATMEKLQEEAELARRLSNFE